MLKLNKLVLKGFGCFKEKTTFDFEDSINMIRAENGHGKTTVLQSIEMMLISNYDGSFSDYINRESTEFEISLDFNLDNFHLLETLNCKQGKSSVTSTRKLIDVDTDKELANGEEVKNWLSTYLPPSTSKFALFARQNSKNDIINCSDSERRDIFKRIQDLDYTKEIKTLITPKIETVKQSIIDVDKEIFSLENKSYDEKSELELPFSKDEYNLKKEKLDKLNTEKALVEERKNRYYELLEKKESVTNNITEINNSISSKKSKIESYEETISNSDIEKDKLVTRCEENKTEIESQISSLKAEIDNLDDKKNDEIIVINNQIDNTSKEIEDFTNEMNSIKLTKLIKFDDTSLINARNNLSELKTKRNISWDNAQKLKSGVCPCCGRSGCEHKYQEFADEADSYERQIIECENLIADLNDKKSIYEKNVEINQKNKEFKTSLQGKIETKNARLEFLKSSLNGLDEEYENKKDNIKLKISNLEQKYSTEEEKCKSDCEAIDEKCSMLISQKKELEDEISDLSKKIETSSKELSSLNKKIDEYENSENEEINTDELEDELKSYDSIVAQNKVIKEYNKKLESDKKNDKIKLEELKDKRKKFENEKFNLESASNIMSKEFPNWMIENSISEIENQMNQFIDDVYYKPLNISLRSTKTSIKLEYGKGTNKSPSSRLSGAETQIVNLSFINNFNKMIGLNCILLDECDSAMDSKRRQNFYESLINMKDIYGQILIVTHNENMQNYIMANSECNLITL